MKIKRLLITGASGFLGRRICMKLTDELDVFGTYCTNPGPFDGEAQIKTDFKNYRETKRLFKTVRPHAVIHLAAIADPGICQAHPDDTRRINVVAAADIAGLCGDKGIPCVFTSTDIVFAGDCPPYSETDPVNPICVYGEQKAEAEERMRARYPQTACFRMPLMFGYSEGARHCFEVGMIQSLASGKEVRLFTDEFRTPVDIESAAEGIIMGLDHPGEVLHLGGKQRVSRYDMGMTAAKLLGADTALIRKMLQKDFSGTTPRPSDVSLDSSKAYGIGYNPENIEVSLRKLIQKICSG